MGARPSLAVTTLVPERRPARFTLDVIDLGATPSPGDDVWGPGRRNVSRC